MVLTCITITRCEDFIIKKLEDGHQCRNISSKVKDGTSVRLLVRTQIGAANGSDWVKTGRVITWDPHSAPQPEPSSFSK